MSIFGTQSFELAQLIPLLLLTTLVFVFSRTLVLPEGYFKDRMIREAMMKRRAEKDDLEKMAAAREERALRAIEEISED